MLNEVWKDVKGYEGFYQVSNIGRVKALPRERVNYRGGKWIQPEQIMATTINRDGYECVSLSMPGHKRKTEKIHRLVAIAFIGNPKKLPEVNHKNCIRHDNRVENLEWISREDNNAYTSKMKHKSNKQIKCIESGEIFATSTEASKKNGGDSANIRKSARNNGRSSVYGFHYIYLEPLSFGELDAN